MSALDEIIQNYKRVNPFGSSHQQLIDDAKNELAQLRQDFSASKSYHEYKVVKSELAAKDAEIARLKRQLAERDELLKEERE